MPKNLALVAKTGFRIVVANHSSFKLRVKTFRKTIFFCESRSPANFGNNQMAHSGRLQRKMPKNLTLLTKTGFRIVFVNHSFFKLLLKTFRKTIFFCESWTPTNFWEQSDGTFWTIATKIAQKSSTFDKNWIQDCVCQSFFLEMAFWKPFEKPTFLWTLESCDFWTQSDGTFWTIATKNAQKLHTFDKSWIQDCVCQSFFA